MGNCSSVPVVGLYGYPEQIKNEGSIHIERIERSPANRSWHVGIHRHYDLYQAIWLESGNGTVVGDSSKHQIGGRSVIWLPAGVVHGFEFSRPSNGMVLTVSTHLLSSAIAQAPDETFLRTVMQTFICDELSVGESDDSSLRDVFRLLEREMRSAYRNSHSANEAILRLLLIELGRLGAINSEGRPVKITDARIYQQFRVLIEANFRKQWSVAQYADDLGITTDRLHRICVAAVGQGPRMILHNRVLMEAKRMLAHTSLSVTEIGFQLGFNDPAYFSRFFAKKAGRCARDFRAENAI